jgi:hypothetical protein
MAKATESRSKFDIELNLGDTEMYVSSLWTSFLPSGTACVGLDPSCFVEGHSGSAGQ